MTTNEIKMLTAAAQDANRFGWIEEQMARITAARATAPESQLDDLDDAYEALSDRREELVCRAS